MSKKSYTSICISIETWDKINKLAKICDSSKSGILAEIIEPLFEVACLYDDAKLEAFPITTRSNVLFQFFGKSNKFAYGKNQPA